MIEGAGKFMQMNTAIIKTNKLSKSEVGIRNTRKTRCGGPGL